MNGTQEWEGAVNQKQHKHLFAMCQCGKVKFQAVGPPILTGSCYCTSCQEAGRQFEQLASAPPVLDSDSGTSLILYRKDRVQCMMGQQYLEEHRLKPDFPTRRVVAYWPFASFRCKAALRSLFIKWQAKPSVRSRVTPT